MPVTHPRKTEGGRTVIIEHPHTPSPLQAWHEPDAIATTVPLGAMPPELNGVVVAPWGDVPIHAEGWQRLAELAEFEEPVFKRPAGRRAAAGAVVLEADGRVWLAAPSNRFAGNKATFPKGHVEAGAELRATAVRECFEEIGLAVELLAHLVDTTRSTTHNRYYLARRVGGDPAEMGWESQAVHLVPVGQLKEVLNNPADHLVVDALLAFLAQSSPR
ncbi:NUDIX hydrolase [Niveibacterium sp.]|uniref:NUDIX hydrolase n=1 Tax=Niveibacterium sp. TaxID=2017444 RepID=UPI0035B25437